MKIGYIYKHTNLVNGKSYIGITVQNPERRWKKGCKKYSSYKNSSIFHKALKKYTWSKFKSEVIFTVLDQRYLAFYESKFIKDFKTLVPNGYNAKDYDDNFSLVYSEEAKNNVSLAKKGKPNQNPAWNRGKIFDIEGIQCKICSRCKKLKPLSEYCANKRKTQTGKDFPVQHSYYCRECTRKYQAKYSYKRKSEEEVKKSYIERGKKSSKALKQKFSNPEARREISLKFGGYKSIDINTLDVKIYECGFDVKLDGYNIPSVSHVLDKPNKSYKGKRWYKINNKK